MKYKLTNEKKKYGSITLYRIKALKDFGNVKKGDKGGWIEKEDNLSQKGDCWVYGNAWVYENAKVYGNAEVYGNAKVYGNAEVYGNAWVYGNACVYDNAFVYENAKVYGNALVSGDAWVYGNAEVYGNAWVYGDARIYGKVKIRDIKLCSRFDFESQEDVNEWIKLEKEFENKIKIQERN
ncbi:MAG: hypothetical protein ACTSQG_09715 [Promethearchaeota archaeon]